MPVFCKDCKHIKRETFYGIHTTYEYLGVECTTEPETVVDPIHGPMHKLVRCETRNAGFDCALFEQQPPPVVKPAWASSLWRLLWKAAE